MASFENVKKIDLKKKKCVFGYIRRMQQLFPDDNIYYTISSLVIHWILSYFASVDEFDENSVGGQYHLSQDNMVITRNKVKDFNIAVYLKAEAKRGIHKWRFKIRACNIYGLYTTIGIWKLNHSILKNQNIYGMNDGSFYAWMVNKKQIIPGKVHEIRVYGDAKCVRGDVIEMILDLEKKTLSYKVNKKDYGVAFENIEDTSYKAFAFINWKDDSLELLSCD